MLFAVIKRGRVVAARRRAVDNPGCRSESIRRADLFPSRDQLMDRSPHQRRFLSLAFLRDQLRLPAPTPPPVRETCLYEPCRLLIAESRRSRAERDKLWAAAIAELSRTDGYCRSLLSEATARLAARERDLPESE